MFSWWARGFPFQYNSFFPQSENYRSSHSAMLRPALLGLLLACAASLGSSAVVLDNGVPLLWAQTFGQVSDLPTVGDTVTLNPFLYLHRMSLYRLMITSTTPLMGCMGPNPTDGPMWGLPLQLSWLLNSGRLADPTGQTNCGVQSEDPMCVSASSWWACENYFTSVLPFLSAAQQGILGDGLKVEMQKSEGFEEYCTTYADCSTKYSDAMTKWDAFFQGLKASADSPLPDNEKKDHLLGQYWEAQMASTYASSTCQAKQAPYSSEEISFAQSWLNSAEYVSAARFQSSLDNSAMFIAPLPSRILKAGDTAPDIADLTAEENHTLSTFSWMKSINSMLGGSLVSMWRRAMCSVSTREKGREMLQQLMLNPQFVTSTFLSIITDMTTKC